jgi:hypothetical protein
MSFGEVQGQRPGTGSGGRSYAYIFRSNVVRLPKDKHKGPLPPGPGQYHPAGPEWITGDPRRPTSAFANKVRKGELVAPITAALDFMSRPEAHDFCHGGYPGHNGLPWSTQAQRKESKHDKPFDGFIVPDTLHKMSLGTAMERSPRLYAATFKGDGGRFSPPTGENPLGPGTYETNVATIVTKDPNLASASFKAQLTSAFSTKPAPQPPDNIISPQMAMDAARWTSSGAPFSTRERFPRVRQRWGN